MHNAKELGLASNTKEMYTCCTLDGGRVITFSVPLNGFFRPFYVEMQSKELLNSTIFGFRCHNENAVVIISTPFTSLLKISLLKVDHFRENSLYAHYDIRCQAVLAYVIAPNTCDK